MLDALSNYNSLLPELVLVGGAILLLMWGVFRPETQGEAEATGWLAILVLAATGVLLTRYGGKVEVFGGAFVNDAFARFMKILALAETHYIGMIPHFTGPIAEAALVHCLTASSVTALMEMLGNGTRTWPYLPKVYDFKDGKLWPNDRPGLGVQVDESKLNKIGEYNTYRAGMLLNQRPDGSFTNW